MLVSLHQRCVDALAKRISINSQKENSLGDITERFSQTLTIVLRTHELRTRGGKFGASRICPIKRRISGEFEEADHHPN